MHIVRPEIFFLLTLSIFHPCFSQDKVYPASMVCKVASLVSGNPAFAAHNRQIIRDSISTCAKLVVYIDSGTYFIDSTIEWKKNGIFDDTRILSGKNKSKTVLKLKDSIAGIDSIPMIRTHEEPYPATATAWSNGIWDLTLDVGTGNSKAIGIVWRSNNWGNIQNVEIRSSDPSKLGKTGIKLDMNCAGPTLIKNVKILGFDVGIRTSQNQAGIVMEHIELDSQNVVGIKNCINSLTIRDLRSDNAVPVIQNFLCTDIEAGIGGMVTLLGGSFTGGSASNSAIENDFSGTLPSYSVENTRSGNLFLRNVSTSGYKSVIRNVPGTSFKQYIYGKNFSAGLKLTDLNPPNFPDTLPILETPEFHDSDLTHWVTVCGGSTVSPDQSWTATDACLTSAIDSITSTNSTLYFPPGNYYYTSTKTIHKKVRRIVGYGANIYPKVNFSTKCSGQGQNYVNTVHYANCNQNADTVALFKIEGDTTETLHIDGINIGYEYDPYDGDPYLDRLLMYQHISNRPIKISFTRMTEKMGEARVYKAEPSAGNLYIENVFNKDLSRWDLSPQQSVWARQWDTEGTNPSGHPKVLNKGGKVWVLGFKTENGSTAFRNLDSGKVEIYGGYLIPEEDATISDQIPAFENLNSGNLDSKMTLVFAHNKQSAGYSILIRDLQGTTDRKIKTEEALYSGDHSRVMLFYSGRNAVFDYGGARISPINLLLNR